jgi:hypothetical protein
MPKKKKGKNYTDQKPPEEYRCIKVPLKSIVKEETTIDYLFDCVVRANKITIKTYQLLRLWVLDKYHNDAELPTITEDTIKMAQKSIIKASSGPKSKGNNLKLLTEFSDLHKFELEDGVHLSQVLGYIATGILTAIENNIKMHFFTYIKRYVNSYFKNKYQEEIKNKEFKKQLFKELNILNNDIINNTKECDEKYHQWLEENRYNIIPKEYEESYYYDIYVTPQKYLKHMVWMNIQLEEIEVKQFQFMPLRTDIIPKAIPIDTKTLIEIFETNKKQKLDDIEGCKVEVWDRLFTIKHKMNNYQFDYTIVTDGYSVSIRFIHDEKAITEKIKKERMKNAKQEYKGLTNDEKEELKKKKAEQTKKENKQKKKYAPKKDKVEYTDFLYIDEVDKSKLEGHRVYIDPGMRSLFYMVDDNGKKLDYTNSRRIKETKRLKYQKLMQNHKNRNGISKIENQLSDYNSKTCDIDKFKEYIDTKNKINKELFERYENSKFRQYKWYSHINRKRCEDNMLNLIEKTYGKDTIFILGDASLGKNMRNFISTPNIAVKRKLKERFHNIYYIDEFRSSCLNHKTEERCENLYYVDKLKRIKLQKQLKNLMNKKRNNDKEQKNIDYIEKYLSGETDKSRKLHSVLTYKMENNRLGCINRDYNACMNIKKLFEHYVQTGDRPLRYQRGYEIEKRDQPSTTGRQMVSCSINQ